MGTATNENDAQRYRSTMVQQLRARGDIQTRSGSEWCAAILAHDPYAYRDIEVLVRNVAHRQKFKKEHWSDLADIAQEITLKLLDRVQTRNQFIDAIDMEVETTIIRWAQSWMRISVKEQTDILDPEKIRELPVSDDSTLSDLLTDIINTSIDCLPLKQREAFTLYRQHKMPESEAWIKYATNETQQSEEHLSRNFRAACQNIRKYIDHCVKQRSITQQYLYDLWFDRRERVIRHSKNRADQAQQSASRWDVRQIWSAVQLAIIDLGAFLNSYGDRVSEHLHATLPSFDRSNSIDDLRHQLEQTLREVAECISFHYR
ncbi:MAG: hypothetical protein Fur005_39850 [Roseiflexaceae bacterium]